MKKLLKYSIFIILLAFFFESCQKPEEPDQVTTTDVKNADLAVADVFSFTNGETDIDNRKDIAVDSADKCYSVVLDTNDDGTFTTSLEFNGSECADGVIRNGKISITWMPGWRISNTKYATVTFENFMRNGNTIDGNLKIYKTGGAGEFTYKIEENDMSLTYGDEKKVTWTGWRTVEFKAGFLTPRDNTDDVRIVNFQLDGINSVGEIFSASAEDIVFDATCDNGTKITSGIYTISKADYTTVVDFGDGECDNTYTVTQNGVSVEVTE